MACADTPSQAVDGRTKQSAPSTREQALLLNAIPASTALRKMKRLQRGRSAIVGGFPQKEDLLSISSKKGEGLKAREEGRAGIVAQVRAHPDFACSPLR